MWCDYLSLCTTQNVVWIGLGRDEEHVTYALVDDTATTADPRDRRNIYAWHLTRTEDPFGNRIVYEYDRDVNSDSEEHRQWDQTYLRTIGYLDFDDRGGSTRYLVSVEFEYEV